MPISKFYEAKLKEVQTQIQKTRGDLEKRVKGLLEDEAKKLNVRLRDIYSYLVKVAQKEQASKKAKAAGSKKTGARKKPSSTTKPKKTGSARKNRAKSVTPETNPALN
jgi:hypothetical protein